MKHALPLLLSFFVCCSAYAEQERLLSDEYFECEESAHLEVATNYFLRLCHDDEYERQERGLEKAYQGVLDWLKTNNRTKSIPLFKQAQEDWANYRSEEWSYIAEERGQLWPLIATAWALEFRAIRIIELENIIKPESYILNLRMARKDREGRILGLPSSGFIKCLEAAGNNPDKLSACAEKELERQNDILDYYCEAELNDLKEVAEECPDDRIYPYRPGKFFKAHLAWLKHLDSEVAFYNSLRGKDAKARGMVWKVYSIARRAYHISSVMNLARSPDDIPPEFLE